MAAKKAIGGSEGYLLTEDEKEKVKNAVEDGDCAPLQKLIKNKWNLNQPLDELGRTALHIAAERGRTEVVRVLVQGGADVDVRDKVGWTPLQWAAERGHTDTVKVMLADKASVDVRDKWGWTPLHMAAQGGHTDIVKVMLANKASVDVRSGVGQTPLHMAARGGHTDTVKVLLANKASVGVRDEWGGNTPLHAAAEYGHTEVVKLLCRESGCDVNTVNENGNTPLHRACEYGRMDVVKLLLVEDGDVTVVNQAGETAYDVCGRGRGVKESTAKNIKEFLKEKLFGRAESAAPPTATIDGADGGVFECKGVQLKVPPNAISGSIEIEFVDQLLLARAVHYDTQGRANLYSQRICMTCTDGDVTFSKPVEVQVTVGAILGKEDDHTLKTKDFRILHEKDGEVTDITEDCNVSMYGREIVFYCKTCSIVNIAWLADFTSSIAIKHILEASYMCRICPYIKEKQDGGLIVKLFCHGVDVECTDDIEHECTSYKMRLINSATLLFGVVCRSIEDDKKKQISSKWFKLERDHCETACTVFEMIEASVRALVADKVRLCVMEFIYKETLMDGAVKVHEKSASGTPSAILLTSITSDPHDIADTDKQISKTSLDESHAVYRKKSDQKVATTEEVLSPEEKDIKIIRVVQPLLMHAVREEFGDGIVYLHIHRLCVETSEHMFTNPVEMRVDISDILNQLGDDKDTSSFFIFKLSHGEVTDITTESNAHLQGHELVYHCLHFCEHVVGWTKYFGRVFSFIQDYWKGTFRAKLCPSAKKKKFGVSLSLLCHVDGSTTPEHQCEQEYPSELHCQQKVMFLARITCKDGVIEKESVSMDVDRKRCEQTGMFIDAWQTVGEEKLGDEVFIEVSQLSNGKKIVLRSREVQIQKDSTPKSPSTSVCPPSELQPPLGQVVEAPPGEHLHQAGKDVLTVYCHRMLADACASIALISGPNKSGTGFRVGSQYLMTNWHVVEDFVFLDGTETQTPAAGSSTGGDIPEDITDETETQTPAAGSSTADVIPDDIIDETETQTPAAGSSTADVIPDEIMDETGTQTPAAGSSTVDVIPGNILDRMSAALFHFDKPSVQGGNETAGVTIQSLAAYDVDLDFAVLKLNLQSELPRRLRHFPKLTALPQALNRYKKINSNDKSVSFAGHPGGNHKVVDAQCRVVQMKTREHDKLKRWSQRKFGADTYPKLDDQRWVLYHTSPQFDKGSSGSPGFVPNESQEPCVAVMQSFLFPFVQPGHNVPMSKIEAKSIEQGVRLEAIYDVLARDNEPLCKDIFPHGRPN